MKQVLIKKGKAFVDNVPVPKTGKGTVLVKVMYSCISAGTEMSGVTSSGKSLIQKVMDKPENIQKGLNMIKEKGITKTYETIKGRFDVGSPTGYSASGVVIEVGENVTEFKIGDRVACAGAGYANHAEYIEVPKNLVVKMPDELDFKEASTVTLGIIAMQGVRRADVRFGENVAIIGMGLLGQLTSQIVTSAGARVIGIDLDDIRLKTAKENGANYILNAKSENVVDQVMKLTEGYGVDSVIITAATNSKEPLAQAFQMSKRKGKVVLVGVVGMEINREDMYKKELDFYMSTSYGPGRYDSNYEENGIDYPYAYVRWTENRNMGEYLKMLSEKKINLEKIIEKVYEIDQAEQAYEELKNSKNKPLMVLLKYNEEVKEKVVREVVVNSEFKTNKGLISVAIVGAGGFAKGMHLPNLKSMKDIYNIYAIMSRTGSNAKSLAMQYGAKYATTDYDKLLEDKDVDMVMICTRHNLHAEMAIKAMKKGKAVFIEKPMALNQEELEEISKTIEETKMPFMVGFNRRFSRYAVEVKKQIQKRVNPMIINYRMNAGYIQLNHWVHTEEGGGRIIGEGCHIFDLFNYFVDSEIESISVNSLTPKTENVSQRDNVVVTVKYKEGSICTLTYTAIGNTGYSKEYCEIYFDGKVITFDDYKKLSGYGVKLPGIETKGSEKGQYEELIEFAKSIKDRSYPISLQQLRQATQTSFIVEDELKK